jgi:hypothetical protein
LLIAIVIIVLDLGNTLMPIGGNRQPYPTNPTVKGVAFDDYTALDLSFVLFCSITKDTVRNGDKVSHSKVCASLIILIFGQTGDLKIQRTQQTAT